MKVSRAEVDAKNRCLECWRPWAAVSIRSFGRIYRCMPCWTRHYARQPLVEQPVVFGGAAPEHVPVDAVQFHAATASSGFGR